ncbi:MAG: alpha/beta hydrolase [Acidibrevibacterium sp.]|uniref:alpha/beta hydrolase n=1 Tax=Acidibrevibacterium sp. TaxID=2606776 RepID=UPI003CFE9A1C
MVDIMPGAEPFAFEGNDVGVLVVHGFTGSTQSMRYLGEGLHRKFGFTVVGPRLPGHGTSPDDMETTGYLDWLGEAERALHDLVQRKRKVFVTGLSMGGTLTLNLAARFPSEVSAIAPIAAAAGLASEALSDALAINPAPKRLPGIGSDIKAPGVVELAYKETPVACLREVTVLISMTRGMLSRIVCPSLVIHSREDHVVPPRNAMDIVEMIRADDIRLLWLNNSYHVATLDNDKALILDRVGAFFREMATA